jgi:DNA-binding transcriptional MerR regulator
MMPDRRYALVLCHDQHEELSLNTLAGRVGLHPLTIERFVELDLITPVRREGPVMTFDAAALARVRMICRLRNTLGINCAGVAVVLDLVNKVTSLQRENQLLRNRNANT